MQRKPYNASAVKRCFWFQEFRKTIELLESGGSLEEIKTLCETENIFDCATPARARQIYHVVSARVRSLDSSFYPVFLSGDLSTKKLTALIAAMANDTLLFDLVYEVIRDKLVIGVQEFSSGDVRAFFRDVQQRDETAAKWTEETCRKLATSYKTMLYEAGLTGKARDRRVIYKPTLEKELEMWLKTHDMGGMIRALTGED